jgi:basic amino acid/polyamine antiporter, APA family
VSLTQTANLPDPGFRRELGLFDSVVVVAGGIVGVGIFANPSNVARVVADPSAILLVWAIGGAVALIGAFVWAELASRFPDVGGQYVYLQRAYPPVVGFLYGIALLFIINGGSLAAVAMLFASYVDRSFVPLGPAGVRAAAAAALIALTMVNIVGVRAGTWTNNALMAAKVGGMLTLVALALMHGAQPASRFALAPASMASGGAIHVLLTALVPILFAYGGWQSCANIAGEIKDPARNLARANVLGVVLVVVLYLSLNVAYLWVLTPAAVAAAPALAADMAQAAAGAAGARFVALLITISSLGFLAVVVLTGARLIYAMAADGLFIAAAGRLHPRWQTPVFALWCQTAISLALLATNTYDQLLSYVVFADWLFFGLTAVALFIVRRRDRVSDVARVPGHPLTTGLFIAVAAGIVINSFFVYPTQSSIGSSILAAAAVAFFATSSRRISNQRTKEPRTLNPEP